MRAFIFILLMALSGCAQWASLTVATREVRAEVKKEEFRLAKAALCRYLDVETFFQEFGSDKEKLSAWLSICMSKPIFEDKK